MKYSLLSLVALFFTSAVFGQITLVDTPHCHDVALHAEVTGGIIPTSSGITADDGWSGVIPIGFTYNFYGLPNTQCVIGSNGCLSFKLSNALGYNTWPIGNTLLGSTAAAPDVENVICGPWCDVYIPAGGTIEYSQQGVAPFRNFAVTWCGTRMYSCTTEWLTTQIIIYETTGIAEVHIGHRTICLTGWNGQHAICGVKDPTGTIATTAPGRDWPAVWAATNEAWRFTPAGTTYTVSSIPYSPIPYAASAIYWYDSTTGAYLGTGPDLTVTPSVTTTYEACALGCNDTTKAFITVMPPNCFEAFSNNPCIGDSLVVGAHGDSTGATFAWTGPGGFTSSLQYNYIFPSTLANQGWYYCTKTVGGTTLIDSTYVTIHPLPVLTLSNNAPLCAGMVDTLQLFASSDSVGETFSWTGPAGFSSTLENPTLPGFGTPNIGNYTVRATTVYGCKDTATIFAGTVPPPGPPPFIGQTVYCFGSTFIPFSASGSNVLYYSTPGGVGSTTPPAVNTSIAGTTVFYATQQIGSCVSPADSISIMVYPQIIPSFIYSIKRGCDADTVDFTNQSLNSTSYTWNFGDGSGLTDSTPALLTHRHIFTSRGLHLVTLTGFNPLCSTADSMTIDTRHDVTASFTPTPDTFCLGYPTTFVNNSTTTFQGSTPASPGGIVLPNAWDFGDGVTDTVWQPSHTYAAAGTFTATLTVTDSIGCTSTAVKPVYVMQLGLSSFHDTTLCLGLPLPMTNSYTETPSIGITPLFTWGEPTANLSDTTIQTPLLTGFGTFVDTLTAYLPNIPPDGCPAHDTITVHSVSGNPITDLTASATISYGSSIQLNASNETSYYWQPNDGTLNNPNINDPIATPSVTTIYTVYGHDEYGCLDSASVTVYVDTTSPGGMPSAFTPNNDGLNDFFHPVGEKYARLVEFRVFNRWGETVFYTTKKTEGWDGSYHGVPQDIGTYFYEIIVGTPGGENITYKGTVVLVR